MSGLLFYIIFALTVAMANADSNLIPTYMKSMACADCDNVKDCRIESEGFYCPVQTDRIQIHYNQDGNISKDIGYLAECIVPYYYFYNKKAISQMCCFWSPHMGCKQLIHINYNRLGCSACAKWDWNSESDSAGCPCMDYEGSKRKKRKRKDGGTKLHHFGVVPMILIHFVQIFSPFNAFGRQM